MYGPRMGTTERGCLIAMGAVEILEQVGLTVDDVRQLCRAHLASASEPILFLSGSLVEGYGNASSDVDLYVLFPDEDVQEAVKPITTPRLGDIRLDLEFWPSSRIDKLREKVNGLQLRSNKSRVSFTHQERVFMHSLRSGIPITSPERLEQLRATFQFSVYQHAEVWNRLADYEQIMEDIEGCVLSRDTITGLVNVRRATDTLMIAYLHLKGDLNPREKWCYRRLAVVHGEGHPVTQAYLRYGFPVLDGRTAEQRQSSLLEAVEWLNNFLLTIQTTTL